MAHTLAIAKASLAAGFMRPDPIPVSRDELSRFHDALDAALSRCSPANIQRCKEWLLNSGITSAPRANSVGKYLVALSASFGRTDVPQSNARNGASARRKQLHILYLLNDVLHHLRYHAHDSRAFSAFGQSMQPYLVAAVNHAAAHDARAFARQHRRIEILLKEWEAHRYFDGSFADSLRKAAETAGTLGGVDASTSVQSRDMSTKAKKETPYMMPATHGDPSAPYHELPAGNMMPQIVPNTSLPINPQQMKALQFSAGPADPRLVEAVKVFLKEADELYGVQQLEDEGISMEMDDIGQSTVRDKATGEVLSSETYYGWSRDFCEKMKQKRSGRRRSRDRSSSRSRSNSPRKRPRYASSYGSRSRSRSYSRSRSRPRRAGGRREQESFSRSRSRSRSISPPRFGKGGRPSPPRSRSPPRHASSNHPAQRPPPPPPQGSHFPRQPPVPYGIPFPNGMPPLGPDGRPLPPPRPPNWQGPWPPPPPPPQSASAGFWSAGPGMAVPCPPPPPPPPGPPPPDVASQTFGPGAGYGSGHGGGGGFGDRGRGGRGRGGWR